MYKEALKQKLRFSSTKGSLTVEDLFDLPLSTLNTMAKNLHGAIKRSEEIDFLDEVTKEDKKIQLSFDIVLDVLNTKKEEKRAEKEKSQRKAEKEKLLEILAKKQDESLENLTEEELLEKLKEYDK